MTLLSERIRPNSEAAPWVIEEIKKLEEFTNRCALTPIGKLAKRVEELKADIRIWKQDNIALSTRITELQAENERLREEPRCMFSGPCLDKKPGINDD